MNTCNCGCTLPAKLEMAAASRFFTCCERCKAGFRFQQLGRVAGCCAATAILFAPELVRCCSAAVLMVNAACMFMPRRVVCLVICRCGKYNGTTLANTASKAPQNNATTKDTMKHNNQTSLRCSPGVLCADFYWRGFLGSNLSSMQLLVFALLTFLYAPVNIKAKLVAHLLQGEETNVTSQQRIGFLLNAVIMP